MIFFFGDTYRLVGNVNTYVQSGDDLEFRKKNILVLFYFFLNVDKYHFYRKTFQIKVVALEKIRILFTEYILLESSFTA